MPQINWTMQGRFGLSAAGWMLNLTPDGWAVWAEDDRYIGTFATRDEAVKAVTA